MIVKRTRSKLKLKSVSNSTKIRPAVLESMRWTDGQTEWMQLIDASQACYRAYKGSKVKFTESIVRSICGGHISHIIHVKQSLGVGQFEIPASSNYFFSRQTSGKKVTKSCCKLQQLSAEGLTEFVLLSGSWHETESVLRWGTTVFQEALLAIFHLDSFQGRPENFRMRNFSFLLLL